MLEQYLIKHCAPTLSGVKTASMFNCAGYNRWELEKELTEWNARLNPKGVFLRSLRVGNGKALIYVYVKNRLEQDLRDPEIDEFLQRHGYLGGEMVEYLDRLAERLGECTGFPHEIGAFLGYPISDVKGFIQNCGKNCKVVGCWKVYSDEEGAERRFNEYAACKEKLSRMFFEKGYPVEELVCAV